MHTLAHMSAKTSPHRILLQGKENFATVVRPDRANPADSKFASDPSLSQTASQKRGGSSGLIMGKSETVGKRRQGKINNLSELSSAKDVRAQFGYAPANVNGERTAAACSSFFDGLRTRSIRGTVARAALAVRNTLLPVACDVGEHKTSRGLLRRWPVELNW